MIVINSFSNNDNENNEINDQNKAIFDIETKQTEEISDEVSIRVVSRADLRAQKRKEKSKKSAEEKELKIIEKLNINADKANNKKGKKRKYRFAPFLGMVMITLSFIGVFSIVFFSVSTILSIQDNSAEKAMIEKDIASIVNLDPVAFDSIENADTVMMLNAALWLTIKSTTDKNFSVNDDGFLIIPNSDIEKYYKKLFGKNIAVNHQTFSSYGGNSEYVYDEIQHSYLIPPTGFIESFIPLVEKIEKSNNQYIVKVGYIMTNSEWDNNTNNTATTVKPYKYMTYVLEKDDNFYVTAIKDYIEE